MKEGVEKKKDREPRKKREGKQTREGGAGKREPVEASREECRPWRGLGTRPGRGYSKPGASPAPEDTRAARDHPSPCQRIWDPFPVRRGGPG